MKKLLIIGMLLFIIILISVPAFIIHNVILSPLNNGKLNASPKIRVYIDETKKTKIMPIDEYLVGVVAAEMPAVFEKEALKAQAVAARTYTLNQIKKKNKYHSGADICTNNKHCQAWESNAQLKKKWGLVNYFRYLKKVQEAVIETQSIVLLYKGKMIDPVYHSSCGGLKTENSEEVWGNYEPYLRSVNCIWDENDKKETKKYSYKEFSQKVFKRKDLDFNNIEVEKTNTGRVKNLHIGNESISAKELRNKLGLKSTLFSWSTDGQDIKFVTIGYGHGVGLCQYGANGLAKKGKKFDEILKYYYKGASLFKGNE